MGACLQNCRAVIDLLMKLAGPLVNLSIGTSALELKLELEMMLQTPLFPVPKGLWTSDLAGW